MHQEWGDLPFYETTDATIVDAIRALIGSKDLRAEYRERGLAHVRRYHDEKPALERLAELYHEAIATYGQARVGRTAAEAVRFRSRSRRSVYVDDKVIAFPKDGVLEVEDPYVITRLRYFAQKRSRLGIEEVTG
jgi:hypothetical protein